MICWRALCRHDHLNPPRHRAQECSSEFLPTIPKIRQGTSWHTILLSPVSFRIQVIHQTQEHPSEFLPTESGIERSASRRTYATTCAGSFHPNASPAPHTEPPPRLPHPAAPRPPAHPTTPGPDEPPQPRPRPAITAAQPAKITPPRRPPHPHPPIRST